MRSRAHRALASEKTNPKHFQTCFPHQQTNSSFTNDLTSFLTDDLISFLANEFNPFMTNDLKCYVQV